MRLERYGYDAHVARIWSESGYDDLDIGRVIAEHRERYMVALEKGEAMAEITGTMRFGSHRREDFPAVGDWVAVVPTGPDEGRITAVLPRTSLLARRSAGREGERQVIAANIDHALVAQSVDRDYNINRLERYLALCLASGASPIVLLTKTDLVDAPTLEGIVEAVSARIPSAPVATLSAHLLDGYAPLRKLLEPGRTYCLLGSSGAGKSTLLNALCGEERMRTGAISLHTAKGRHVTTHRELVVLEDGAILIDNPGMREIGMAEASEAIATTFASIATLGRACRFRDCTHLHETGCAVRAALEDGRLNRAAYDNFLRMERENAHYEASAIKLRRKDRDFGKLQKNYGRQKNGF